MQVATFWFLWMLGFMVLGAFTYARPHWIFLVQALFLAFWGERMMRFFRAYAIALGEWDKAERTPHRDWDRWAELPD